MEQFVTPEVLTAFAQVILIDLVLAGDNAIVIGLAAAGLPADQRNKAILVGVVAATVLRIAFAGVTTQLLQVVGLLFAGGLLLLWVCWKMWRDLRAHAQHEREGTGAAAPPAKSFSSALLQIMLADLSMSLDNVLAVAGAARQHPALLVFGLLFSIALMGVAASWIARILNNMRWLGYVGLLVVVYVAAHMVWDGHRSLIMDLDMVKEYNSYAPASLEITEAEAKAHHDAKSSEPVILSRWTEKLRPTGA